MSVKSGNQIRKRHPSRCLFFVAAIFTLNTAIAGAATHSDNSLAHCLITANAVAAKIASVTDGDTVVLNDGRRVRLIGINTLELNSAMAQDKAWAIAAKNELEKTIQSKRVSLIPGIEEFDRHGRTLAHLLLDNGVSVAEALISKGLGLSIAVGSNQRCAGQYEQSEQFAREAGLGIWQNPGNWFSDRQKLTGRERGFSLVISTVEKVYEVKNRPTLELKNGLRVTLNKHFFDEASDTIKQLRNLQGKRIEVRGWLRKVSGKQNLNLSHPTNLRVLSY